MKRLDEEGKIEVKNEVNEIISRLSPQILHEQFTRIPFSISRDSYGRFTAI